ncbi:two component heavy metal response transcriptional regulator [Ktedonobacter racemifer DSM 44963]|uniref:Two component heavy metal response transcriptional regulator n=1 Tax=Ktedonobacter racemifer DSM 44963 TaxID=485913 RepID=D6TDD6_KTERA|nr:two component heavy metal response transcriptional regulator [Ktedonobacter racemifer DSM 44963]
MTVTGHLLYHALRISGVLVPVLWSKRQAVFMVSLDSASDFVHLLQVGSDVVLLVNFGIT